MSGSRPIYGLVMRRSGNKNSCPPARDLGNTHEREGFEEVIDLTRFADQGVNLADVDNIAIGLGVTGNATASGGSGTLFIDDIRLYRPRDVAGE